MCYIRVCQNEGPWQQCGEKEAENIDCQQYWTLINLPTSSRSSTSLLHQLIQAWSDTWASGVSAAIKMPPLEHFNWNFCCWCVNSCRTEKGRSIMLALRRPPGVKWQQLLWQNTPLMLLFIYDFIALPVPASAQSHVCMVAVAWQTERKRERGRVSDGILGHAGQVKWPTRTYL